MAKQHLKLAQADKQRTRLGLSPIRVPTTRINVINNLGKLFINVDEMTEQQMSMAIEEVSENLIEDWLALNVPSSSTISFMFCINNVHLGVDDIMLPSDIAKSLIASKIGNYEELGKLSHVQKSASVIFSNLVYIL
jgi:hypothetical protein